LVICKKNSVAMFNYSVIYQPLQSLNIFKEIVTTGVLGILSFESKHLTLNFNALFCGLVLEFNRTICLAY